MSDERIDKQVKINNLQKQILDAIYYNIDERMKTKDPQRLIDNTNSPLVFDYKKSKDLTKLRLLIHSSFAAMEKLVSSFYAQNSKNIFFQIFEAFADYSKHKVQRLKTENAELAEENARLNQRMLKIETMHDWIEEMLGKNIMIKEGGLKSQGNAGGVYGGG